MILDRRETQALNEAGESGLVEVIRGGDKARWCLLWMGGFGATHLSSLIFYGTVPGPLTLRLQGRTQVFHPPGNTASCPCRTWDALVSSLPLASIPIFTSGQKSNILIWYFSMKLYLSLPTIISDSNLYTPQLEFMQSLPFFFFFNLKNWMCLPDNKVSKGARFMSQFISVSRHLVINCWLGKGMNERWFNEILWSV